MNIAERTPNFLRLPAVQRKVPVSKSSLYQMIHDGEFPAQYRLGPRAVGWLEHEVDAWIEARARAEPPIPVVPRPVARKRNK